MPIAIGRWVEAPLAPWDGNANVVAVGSAGNLWYTTDTGKTYQFTGVWHINDNMGMNWISAGADGMVWGANWAGVPTWWNPSLGSGEWEDTWGVTLTQISVGSATLVWGIDESGKLWRWTGTSWTPLEGSDGYVFTSVSVASDGTAWAVATGQVVLSWTGSGWRQMPGTLDQVAVGSSSNIWGITTAFGSATTYQWTGSDWNAFDQSLTSISAASDGTVFGIAGMGGGNLYYFERLGDLSISGPQLGQSGPLVPGNTAVYLFTLTNNSQAATATQLQLTPVYATQAFTAAGLTVTPSSQTLAALKPGASMQVAFTVSAASGAAPGTYAFSGVQATYTLADVLVPIDNPASAGWMVFDVGQK